MILEALTTSHGYKAFIIAVGIAVDVEKDFSNLVTRNKFRPLTINCILTR